MAHRSVRIFSILVLAFIPWLIIHAAMGAGTMLPRPFFIILHYTLAVLLFGIVFAIYYKWHTEARPFTVMASAMVGVFVFEVVYLGWMDEGERQFLNYIDWIVPMFLIASTIYFVGRFFQER